MGLWPVKVDFAMCQFVPIGAEQKAREKMLGSTCLFFESMGYGMTGTKEV